MSTDSWIELGIAFAALVVLGLAALVEASFAAVHRLTIRSLVEERAVTPHTHALVDRPQMVRSAMLVIELVMGTLVATMIFSVLQRELPDGGALAGVVVALVLVLLIGRVIPAAVTAAEPWAARPRFDRLASALLFVFRPVTALTNALTGLLAPLFRPAERPEEVEMGEAAAEHAGAGVAEEAGEIEQDEEEMITGILDLEKTAARDIMVPRPDIVAVPVDMPVREVVDLTRRVGHSRIPVYRDTIDDIVGVVYAKDFLRFVGEELDAVPVAELVRPAYIVPETKRVDELLRDFREQRVHIAIVVDEYGGTAGLVTIEDVLEEIVGEIQDEYDRETPLIQRESADEAIVDGRIPVSEIADMFDTAFAEGESGSVGGYVQKLLGRIPTAGEVVRADGLEIEVQAVEQRRIRKLRVRRVASDVASDGEAESRRE